MKRSFALVFSSLAAIILMTQVLHAFPQFSKGFKTLYLENASEEFNQAVKSAKCNLCHDPNKKRTKASPARNSETPTAMPWTSCWERKTKKTRRRLSRR